MMRVRRFARGGMVIQDNRDQILSQAPFTTWLPSVAQVPIHQFPRQEPRLLVKVGDVLEEGQLVAAKADGSLAIHAPIPGRVESITERTLADGRITPTLQIVLGGSFAFFSQPPKADLKELPQPEKALDELVSAGLIYNETYPDLAYYLAAARGKGAHILVLDGLEAAPYQAVDQALLQYYPHEVSVGLQLLRGILGVERVVVVVSTKAERGVREFLRQADRVTGGVHVVVTDARYPLSDPSLLLATAVRKKIEPNADPLSAGVALFRPEHLYGIQAALVQKKPAIETFLTVSGPSLKAPRVVRTRIGTSIGQVVADLGGIDNEDQTIVIGDPLRGYRTTDWSLPVTKETRSIVLLEGREPQAVPEVDCIHCGLCIQHCPSGLEPQLLYKQLQRNDVALAMEAGLDACTSCGLCSYVCPANIPLVQKFRVARAATIEGRP